MSRRCRFIVIDVTATIGLVVTTLLLLLIVIHHFPDYNINHLAITTPWLIIVTNDTTTTVDTATSTATTITPARSFESPMNIRRRLKPQQHRTVPVENDTTSNMKNRIHHIAASITAVTSSVPPNRNHNNYHSHRYILPPDFSFASPKDDSLLNHDHDNSNNNDHEHSSMEKSLSSSSSSSSSPLHTTTMTTIMIEIPIVIQLSGELGNHLSKIAAGIGVAAMIHQYNPYHYHTTNKNNNHTNHQSYQFTTNLHVRHQDHTTKGETALHILQQCFPNLLHIQEEMVNDDDINAVTTTTTWNVNETLLLRNNPHRHSTSQHYPQYPTINSHRAIDVDDTISHILQDAIHMYEVSQPTFRVSSDTSTGTTSTTITNTSSSLSISISSPFIVYSNHLVGYFDVYMDRFYDLYRQYFIINETNPKCGCLATTTNTMVTTPYNHNNNIDDQLKHPAEEIVFYYRGYQIEMPKKAIALGYEEISPTTLISYIQNITSRHVSERQQPQPQNHTISSPRVRIVSRFPNQTQMYQLALIEAGYTVQVTSSPPPPPQESSTNHNNDHVMTSILQDFCVLRRAQHYLIGPIRSTFYMWATILADRNSNSSSGNNHNNNRNRKKRRRSATTAASSSSSLHITAYTTPSQIEWALKQHESSSTSSLKHTHTTNTSTTTTTNTISTAAYDSIVPSHYESIWKERNFHFVTL